MVNVSDLQGELSIIIHERGLKPLHQHGRNLIIMEISLRDSTQNIMTYPEM